MIHCFFQLHPRPTSGQQRAHGGTPGGAHRHPHLPPARRLQLQEDQESPLQNQVHCLVLQKHHSYWNPGLGFNDVVNDLRQCLRFYYIVLMGPSLFNGICAGCAVASKETTRGVVIGLPSLFSLLRSLEEGKEEKTGDLKRRSFLFKIYQRYQLLLHLVCAFSFLRCERGHCHLQIY